MTKQELTDWALANGWQMIAGHPSLTKPSSRKEAIVRMVLKATVAAVEVKKPEGAPQGLGFETIPGFAMLMRDNKDQMVFSGASWGGKA